MQIYRYSSLSRCSIIDLANNIVYPRQPQQLRTRGLEDPQLYLRYATWNKEDNSLIYVYENDIYFRGVPNASTDVRLTKDGERDTVFNGVPDWVYEGKPILSHLLLLQLIYFCCFFQRRCWVPTTPCGYLRTANVWCSQLLMIATSMCLITLCTENRVAFNTNIHFRPPFDIPR